MRFNVALDSLGPEVADDYLTLHRDHRNFCLFRYWFQICRHLDIQKHACAFGVIMIEIK
jgi:hypothetical protein